LIYHYTNVEKGLTLRRYWTTACQSCAIKDQCTTGKERRIGTRSSSHATGTSGLPQQATFWARLGMSQIDQRTTVSGWTMMTESSKSGHSR